jgi:serine/threonine protein kinase
VLGPEVLRNKEAVARFFNEARAVARIDSDRVVRMLDLGVLADGLPFMVMERLEGVDLGDLLKERGPLPVAEAVDLVVEALEGVSHAHFEGIVHRDLKPSNLFLARGPDGARAVKVLDFGISKMSSLPQNAGRLTATSAVLGSPLYMSPEQLRSSKSIDARADLWSMGVIIHELLTGTVPFIGDNVVEIFAAIQETEPVAVHALRPDVPPALSAIVRRCLQRKAQARHATRTRWPRRSCASARRGLSALSNGSRRTTRTAGSRLRRRAAPSPRASPPRCRSRRRRS